MYTHCTTEKAAWQQSQFEQRLLLIMQKYDYNDISVRYLCEDTGLSRNTFYRLFGNKDDVLYALIDHTLKGYSTYCLPSNSVCEDSPEELQRFFSYWYSQKDLLDSLTNNQQTALLLERLLSHIRAEEPGILRLIGADIQMHGTETLMFFTSGIVGLIASWQQSGYEKSISEMAAITNRLISNPPISFPKIND